MEEKVCGNCKYYAAHYVISGVYLIEVEGHCMERLRKNNVISNIEKRQKSCKKWESAKAEKEKDYENILKTIRDIQKRLSDIALILRATDDSDKLH